MEEHRHEEPVHDVAGGGRDLDGDLADALHEALRGDDGAWRRSRGKGELDQLHRADRVEEVESQELFGALDGVREGVEGKRRGVRREDRAAGDLRFDAGEKRALRVELLDGRFDHEIAFGEGGEVRAHLDASEDLVAHGLGHLPALHAAVEDRADPGAGLFGITAGGLHRDDRHTPSRDGRRDPAAHDSASNDSDLVDHLTSPTARPEDALQVYRTMGELTIWRAASRNKPPGSCN